MAIIHWKHPVTGDFAVAANWNPATVPGTSDTAAIDAASLTAYTVSASSNETVASLTTIATATLSITGSTFTINNGTGTGANAGTIAVGNGTELNIGGIIENTGKIKENAAGSLTEIIFATGAGATFTGGGKLLLSDDPQNFIFSNAPDETFTNLDNIIAGSGQIGDGAGSTVLDNEAKGVIDATGKINPLSIFTGNPVTNLGILEATGPAGLVIKDTVDNWPSGIVQALVAGSVVSLQGATLVGGTLKTANGGLIRVDGSFSTSTLDGATSGAVTNAGNLVVSDGNTLTLLGTINNKGSIAPKSTGDDTILLIGTGGAALQGGGKVILANALNDEIASASGTDLLLNTDNTIVGTGELRAKFINAGKGIVDATTGGMLIQDGVGNSNAGMLEATGGAELLILKSTIDNSLGVIQAVGAGSSVRLQTATIVGGKFASSGGGKIVVNVSAAPSVLDGSTPGAPVTNTGSIVVADQATLALIGTINNLGSIAVNAISVTTLQIGPRRGSGWN